MPSDIELPPNVARRGVESIDEPLARGDDQRATGPYRAGNHGAVAKPRPDSPPSRAIEGITVPVSRANVNTPGIDGRSAEDRIAFGESDKQIAQALSLSPRTVEMHAARALAALGCRTRAEAVRRATERRILGA